ncbi:MAG: Uma2 family endonuclease [Leptolyngbya sp. SIO4C5]|nr:Uma2 family endonuclease [Leptolyngbya sp. SIO4C5]
MVLAYPAKPAHPLGEQRVVFRSLSWPAYQQVLSAVGDNRAARLTYDCGLLEITMPLEDHEFYSELIGRFVYFLVSELGQKIKSLGSTTLEREDLKRAVEPDKAYYIQNQSQVAGKKIDLDRDPPPDLVIEVDITHTDVDKLSLYAAMGVAEFWRYNGQLWRIYQLEGDRYQEVDLSPTFPRVPKQKLYDFLAAAEIDEIEAEQSLRQWIRQQT